MPRTKKLLLTLSSDWYRALLEEASAIIVETTFNARDTIVRGKWMLGQRVVEERDNFEKAGFDRAGTLKRVSTDLNISIPELYSCMKFVEKFPELDKFLEKQGKNLTWHHIVHQLLPENPQPKGEPVLCVCVKCGDEHKTKKT